MARKPQVSIMMQQSHPKVYPISRFRRPVLKTVFLTPVVFLWLFVIAYVPVLKKLWDPSPLQIRIVGKITSKFLDCHIHAFVTREPRQDEINSDDPTSPTRIPETLAIVVDRPQRLLNISKHTIRIIEHALEKQGYEAYGLMVMFGATPIHYAL